MTADARYLCSSWASCLVFGQSSWVVPCTQDCKCPRAVVMISETPVNTHKQIQTAFYWLKRYNFAIGISLILWYRTPTVHRSYTSTEDYRLDFWSPKHGIHIRSVKDTCTQQAVVFLQHCKVPTSLTRCGWSRGGIMMHRDINWHVACLGSSWPRSHHASAKSTLYTFTQLILNAEKTMAAW